MDIEKAKRNIKKMIDAGAPETDIDQYLAIEGITVEQLKSLAPLKESMQPFTGDILPVSRKEPGGDVEFDSDAGIVGAVKRAVQLPRQVYEGKVDPLSNEGMERTLEAATFMTPMGTVSRMGKGALAPKSSKKVLKPKAPTRKELRAATDAGYEQARAMGAEYKPSSVADWATKTTEALNAEGRIAENYPEVHTLLKKLGSPPDDAHSVTLESIDAAYRELGRLAGSPDTAKASAASLVQKSLDDFHSSLDSSALVAGTATPKRAAEVLKEARGNAAAGFRSDRVTGLEQTAARRAAAANSGRNTDNTIRQRLTSLIESAKGSRGLSKEEMTAIDDIIFGRPSKNAARYFGNLLGGGGGLGSTVLSAVLGVGGASTMGPGGAVLGAVLPTVGALSRSIANGMSKKELKALDDLIRMRSPAGAAKGPVREVYQPGAMQGVTETGVRGLLAPKPEAPPRGLIDYGWL